MRPKTITIISCLSSSGRLRQSLNTNHVASFYQATLHASNSLDG